MILGKLIFSICETGTTFATVFNTGTQVETILRFDMLNPVQGVFAVRLIFLDMLSNDQDAIVFWVMLFAKFAKVVSVSQANASSMEIHSTVKYILSQANNCCGMDNSDSCAMATTLSTGVDGFIAWLVI